MVAPLWPLLLKNPRSASATRQTHHFRFENVLSFIFVFSASWYWEMSCKVFNWSAWLWKELFVQWTASLSSTFNYNYQQLHIFHLWLQSQYWVPWVATGDTFTFCIWPYKILYRNNTTVIWKWNLNFKLILVFLYWLMLTLISIFMNTSYTTWGLKWNSL